MEMYFENVIEVFRSPDITEATKPTHVINFEQELITEQYVRIADRLEQ